MRIAGVWSDLRLTARVVRVPKWVQRITGHDSIVFWSAILTTLTTITTRHLQEEMRHVRQYKERGALWVWTHAKEREAEAHPGVVLDEPIIKIL